MSDTPKTDALIASFKDSLRSVSTETEIKLARLCFDLERENVAASDAVQKAFQRVVELENELFEMQTENAQKKFVLRVGPCGLCGAMIVDGG